MAADSSHAANANEKDKLPERVVLWDETEVAEKQVNQVGTSACGATAVLNVLVRLNYRIKGQFFKVASFEWLVSQFKKKHHSSGSAARQSR